jgi:hypothetical protein
MIWKNRIFERVCFTLKLRMILFLGIFIYTIGVVAALLEYFIFSAVTKLKSHKNREKQFERLLNYSKIRDAMHG